VINASLKIRNGLVLVAAILSVAACGADQDDLDQYINEVKARPGGRIEPLPEITPYEVFTYVADAEGVRSPFVPDTPQATTTGAGGGIRPDSDRSREFLEGFPLDTLRMVGTLNMSDTMYGLDDGRINTIDESEIELVEIISDGIGGYIERDAAISLSD
jgi:type IV pilus assembly protein PilP